MAVMRAQQPTSDPNDRSDTNTPPQSSRPSSPFRPLSPSKKKHPVLEGFIPPHGGYQNLLAYQKSLVVFDATIYFCDRFIDRRSRTHDQMVQAARSGKQNILEGSEASGTSKEAEIKLTGVAKASQKELLEDYRDFMRNRGIEEWPPDHRYAMRLRALNRTPGANYQTFKKGIEHPDPAICANVIVGLIKVTTYLLDRQLRRLERDFLNEGGLRERMTRARLAHRAKQNNPPPPP